jgi:hypothetical protein
MNMKYLIQLILLVFFFGACQKEEANTVNQNPKNIIVNSPFAKLISRTSQNPTAIDNVIDNTSCFSVQLPVTVVVNWQNITVTTQADYQLVQNAIDQFTMDDDIVHFNFPITVKFQNFATQVINNSTQFNNAIEACEEDDGFDEIDCIAINYPFKINIYDSNNQVANTITIQNNSQLFNFIATLSNGIIAAIVYPISVTDSNAQSIVINSNTELETFIDSSIDDCEDSGGGPTPTFLSVLNSGSWHVSYFYKDQDDTAEYTGYNFTFISNGTINVIKNTNNSNGSWLVYTDSGENKIDLSFDNSNLEELMEDWIITEYTATTIHLKHVSGGGGGSRYLYFSKN